LVVDTRTARCRGRGCVGGGGAATALDLLSSEQHTGLAVKKEALPQRSVQLDRLDDAGGPPRDNFVRQRREPIVVCGSRARLCRCVGSQRGPAVALAHEPCFTVGHDAARGTDDQQTVVVVDLDALRVVVLTVEPLHAHDSGERRLRHGLARGRERVLWRRTRLDPLRRPRVNAGGDADTGGDDGHTDRASRDHGTFIAGSRSARAA
jgi:hypothetical protein